MKKTTLITMAILVSSAIFPDSGATQTYSQTGNITVNTIDLEENGGELYFLIYKTKEGFPKTKNLAYKTARVSSYSSNATYTFKDIPYGQYAISFFQDENGNGELDDNFLGIPKEPVGASNMTSMGKPSFEKCKFQLNQNDIKMTLKVVL